MASIVNCPCGRRLKARDEDLGKRVRCPSCGTLVLIEEVVALEEVEEKPAEPLRFQALTLDIGTISARYGTLSMSLKINDDGDGEVHPFVIGRDSRRSSELIGFGPDTYEKFLALVEETSSTIRRLQSTGQMSKMLTSR
jgi:hypothetical protein